MSRSTVITVSQAVPIRRSRTGLIALWGLQVGLATLFLFAGGSKLAGAPAMVALFEAIGIGQWFRYVTGLVEVTSAVALLMPSLAPFGALLLAGRWSVPSRPTSHRGRIAGASRLAPRRVARCSVGTPASAAARRAETAPGRFVTDHNQGERHDSESE
jgi:hypothetical protein